MYLGKRTDQVVELHPIDGVPAAVETPHEFTGEQVAQSAEIEREHERHSVFESLVPEQG